MKKYIFSKEFTEFPGPRYERLGPYSGESFRKKVLIPIIESGEKVVIDLDGVIGFGSSFLEEAFGGMVREGFERTDVMRVVDNIVCKDDPSLIQEIKNYVVIAYKEA